MKRPVSLSDEEELEVVYKAVKAMSQLSNNNTHSGETQLANQQTEVIDSQQGTSMSSTSGACGSDAPELLTMLTENITENQ